MRLERPKTIEMYLERFRVRANTGYQLQKLFFLALVNEHGTDGNVWPGMQAAELAYFILELVFKPDDFCLHDRF